MSNWNFLSFVINCKASRVATCESANLVVSEESSKQMIDDIAKSTKAFLSRQEAKLVSKNYNSDCVPFERKSRVETTNCSQVSSLWPSVTTHENFNS